MDFYLGLIADHRRSHAARAVGLLRAAHRPGEPRPGRLLRDRRLCRRHAHGARAVAARPGARRFRRRRRRDGLRGRFPGLAGQGPDAGGRDHRVRRGGAAVLLQFHLPGAGRKSRARAAWRRGLPPDPLLSGKWLDHARRHAVHLGGGRLGDGRRVVARPFARRRRAARGRRGRARRAKQPASTSPR